MHLIETIRLAGCWYSNLLHVAGVLDDVANGILRWDPDGIC